MSRVRPKVIKDAAKRIIVNYWDVVKEIWDRAEEMAYADPALATDYRFRMYKKLVEMTTNVNSKSVRNRIAGYIITLMKQILYLGRFTIEELATKYKIKTQPITISTSETSEESAKKKEGSSS